MKQGTFEGFELWVNRVNYWDRSVTVTSPVGRASDIELSYHLLERMPE